MLRQIPFPAFSKEGALRSEAATVLAVDEAGLAALNGELGRVLTAYRNLEVTHAVVSQEQLPNLPADQGLKLTVQVPRMPEEGKAAREQFEATLRQHLGEQRASIVRELASSWFDSEFSASGAQPKSISVQRQPEGGYAISVESGNGNKMSTSGPIQLEQYSSGAPAPLL